MDKEQGKIAGPSRRFRVRFATLTPAPADESQKRRFIQNLVLLSGDKEYPCQTKVTGHWLVGRDCPHLLVRGASGFCSLRMTESRPGSL